MVIWALSIWLMQVDWFACTLPVVDGNIHSYHQLWIVQLIEFLTIPWFNNERFCKKSWDMPCTCNTGCIGLSFCWIRWFCYSGRKTKAGCEWEEWGEIYVVVMHKFDQLTMCFVVIDHTYITREYINLWMYQLGFTPLIFAARHDRLAVVEYLVEQGADLEAKDNVSDVTIWCESNIRHLFIFICIRTDLLRWYMLHYLVSF